MKHLIKVSIILALLVSLSRNSAFAESGTADSSYFPLSIGNEWSFVTELYSGTERISDTATIHGKLFYLLFHKGIWFRFSNDSVFVATRYMQDTVISLLYNFNANVGDTINLPSAFDCSFGAKVVLMSKQDTVTVPAGTFTNCYHFQHFAPCFDAGMCDSWFAKGVGRIKYCEMNLSGLITYNMVSYQIVTAVERKQSKVNPGLFKLGDAYPNPFNPLTTISFDLSLRSFVSLKILDLLGKEVATIISEELPAGNYSKKWNASNVSSGIYFYRLQAGSFSETKKLLLLK